MPLQTMNMHQKADDFKPTTEELDMIRKKMDDPEFMRLWAEYAKDISDPKVREEEEAYLKQMEAEAREGGDYSFDFVFPTPCFAVALQNDGRGGRTVVNVCSSDKIEEFREDRVGGGRDANWHVPVSVGKERSEEHDGRVVSVFDAVFHPKTATLADRSERFMCFLVEIAVENINGGYGKRFGFEFQRLSSSTKSVGKPANQTLRRKGGENPFAPADLPVSAKPEQPGSATQMTGASSASPTKAATAAPAKSGTQRAPPSAAPKVATRPTNEPKHTLTHRGSVDLSEAWADVRAHAGADGAPAPRVPKELVLAVELPQCPCAADIDVDLQSAFVTLEAPLSGGAPYAHELSLPLPYSVKTTPASAKFDKNARRLTLVLTVVPPKAVPPKVVKAAAAPVSDATEVRQDNTEDPPQAEPTPASAEPVIAPATADAPDMAVPTGSPACGVGTSSPESPPAVAAADAAPAPEVGGATVPSFGERMVQMQAKMAAARKMLETAETQAAEEDAAEQQKVEVARVDAAKVEAAKLEAAEAVVGEAGAAKAQAAKAEAANAASGATDTTEEPIPFIRTQKAKVATPEEQMKVLDQALADAAVAAREAAEAAAAEAAHRKALAEAEAQQKREREEERLEALLGAKMAELPLTSADIFAID